MLKDKYHEQKKTLKDAKEKLKKHSKCVIIRPTGFGKTYMLTELIKEYKNVLYLYPSAVVRDTVVDRYYEDYDGEVDAETIETYIQMKEIANCTLMTYAKLIRLNEEEFESMSYDLIIFDEVHRVGGPLTKIAVEKLFAYNKNTHFIGATATPTRMDNFDAVAHFFCDIMTYTYTLFDAINDGLLKKPNYCYCTYDIETDLVEGALKAGEDIKSPDVKNVIAAKLIELSTIFNMPNIIRETCEEYVDDTSYMKFIVFFSNKKHMSSKTDDVMKWFKEAYPTHTISALKISSKSHEERENVEKLEGLKRKKNHIDIIACIDMLNMGYHVNDQTGILMYRGTKSNTIFIQQLGRALSAGANNSALVFDVVDNLHRKAIYELRKRLSTKRYSRKMNGRNVKSTTYRISAEDNSTIICIDNKGEIINTQYHLCEDGAIVDNWGNQSMLILDTNTGFIYEYCSEEGKNINNITSTCLNATKHEAKYREILAKAVAEPMTQRCKYALELHFRTWCQTNGIPYPISDAELKSIYNLSKEDFYKEFCNIIKNNKINYPLQDAEKLLKVGEGKSTDVPLSICAKARNVSITQILDVFGVK